MDPYRELGLSPEACTEPELVRAAFKALAKKYHPDTATDPAVKARAEEKMQRLNEAQRLILSGEYRPPLKDFATAAPATPQAPLPPTPQAAAPPAVKAKTVPQRPRTIPLFPMAMAAICLLFTFLAPGFTGRRQFEKAQKLESQGKYQAALEAINETIAYDTRNGQALLFRARLWKHLGYPDRVKTDLANARMMVSPPEFAEAEAKLLPAPTPSPSPS